MADSKDLNGNYFSPEACLRRELFEELHLDLKNKKHILNYQMKYEDYLANEEIQKKRKQLYQPTNGKSKK